MAAQTYPVAVISKLLDLTPRRVQHLANEGVIPRAEKGRYELVPAVRGYIRYLRDRSIGRDGEGEGPRRADPGAACAEVRRAGVRGVRLPHQRHPAEGRLAAKGLLG